MAASWLKKIGGVVLFFLLTGCVGGLYFPGFENDLPVFYPENSGRGSGQEAMVEAFGTTWRDLRREYPDYRFNP